MRKWVRTTALLVAVAMIAASCGGDDTSTDDTTETTAAPAQLTPVNLQLQWFAQAQFAGYYAADALGYYEDEGST